MSVIKDTGPAGKQLARLVTKTRLVGEYLGGKWKVAAKEATKDLTPEQRELYVDARDKGLTPGSPAAADPAVVRALELRKVVDDEVTSALKATGAGLRTGEGKIPFQERPNHWPHIYTPEYIKQNKAKLISDLVSEGMTQADAELAIKNSARFGERLISAQHERQTNAPGFRRDLDADYQHLGDMGKRVAEAREFGAMDIAKARYSHFSVDNQDNRPKENEGNTN